MPNDESLEEKRNLLIGGPPELVRRASQKLGGLYGLMSHPTGREMVQRALEKAGSTFKLPFAYAAEKFPYEEFSGIKEGTKPFEGATEKTLKTMRQPIVPEPVVRPGMRGILEPSQPQPEEIAQEGEGVGLQPSIGPQQGGDFLSNLSNLSEAGYQKQKQSLERMGGLVETAAREESRVLEAQSEEARLRMIDRDEKMFREESKMEQMSFDYDQTRQSLLDQMDKVPNFWEDSSTPKKILAATSMILSGVTGKDLGLSLVESIISSEVQQQKRRTEILIKSGEMSDNMFGRYLEKYESSRVAEIATYDMMNQMQLKDLQSRQLISQSPVMKEKINMQIGQLQQKQATIRMEMAKAWHDMIVGGGEDIKTMSAESAGKFSISLSSLEDIQETRNILGTIDWNLLGESQRQQTVNALTESLARGLSGAAIPEAEWERFMKWIPHPTDSNREASMKIKRLENIFRATVVAMDPAGAHRRNIARARKGSLGETIGGVKGPSLGFEANL